MKMKRIIGILLLTCVFASSPPVVQFTSYAATKSVYDGCAHWTDAGKYVGKTITVYGKVTQTKYAYWSNGGPTFLNFTTPYTDGAFYVVIFEQNRSKFSSAPETKYKGKNIKVTGTVKAYNGMYEIVVTKPSQIEIVK